MVEEAAAVDRTQVESEGLSEAHTQPEGRLVELLAVADTQLVPEQPLILLVQAEPVHTETAVFMPLSRHLLL